MYDGVAMEEDGIIEGDEDERDGIIEEPEDLFEGIRVGEEHHQYPDDIVEPTDAQVRHKLAQSVGDHSRRARP